MQVLHAVWNKGNIYLWVESSALPLSAPGHRGRKPKKPKPRAHPFALAGDELKEVVRSICEQTFLKQTFLKFETKTFLLPSTPKGPLPSPWLIREEDYSAEKATELMGWDIGTLTFDKPYLAFDFLLGLPEQPPRGIAFGSSLRFWIEAARFSLELITRQQFVPAIKAGKQDFWATWDAVITEEDEERVRMLAEAMPPSCRAFPDKDKSQMLSPAELVLSFVNRTVDAFVRESIASIPLLPPRRGRRPKVAPLPEQWLQTLSTDNPVLVATPEELNSFSTEMQAWLAQLQPAAPGAPFRTCFRLDPPSESEDEENGEDWAVRFFLQAKDDRSLLVPADEVWKTRSSTLTFLKRRFENAQEQLLADLGKASRAFSAIEKSLQTARPAGLELNAEQAYSFLRQSAPLLEQSGFGVLLPSWWEKPGARIGVKLRLKPALDESGKVVTSGLLGVKGIIAYDRTVAIGDETLSADEFEQLASLKVPLVWVRGQWVELRQEDIETAIEFFKKKHSSGEMTLGEAMQLGLGGGVEDVETEVGLPVVEVETEGWLEDMLNNFSEGLKITTVKTPRTFHGKLRPYQIKGVSWLAYLSKFGFGACLADDMGLGKTIELIALLLHERSGKRGKKPAPTLLICPMSVVGNWQKEVERFAPSLKVMVHHGADRLTGKIFAGEAKKNDLVISTYALAHRDEETLSTVPWQHVVLDEAQNIKNPSAKQTQAIKKLEAEHRIALTGTPVENRLSELWSIMDFLNPGYLKSAQHFRTNFALPIEKYRKQEQAEMLRRIIQPFVLRRVKTDPTIIKDLPDKMEMKVYYNLTREQASLYEAVVAEMIGRIEELDRTEESEGIERKGLVLATLMKLKQICNHPALFLQDGSVLEGRSGKLARLEEMLEEVLAAGDKALIFTQFAGMGVMLRQYLQDKLGCETLFLYGGTPRKQRDAMILRFQNDPYGPPLFILSLKAGGFGLNLTAANHVFHFDRWWNPAVENQATDRVFRIGQTKNVQVHKFVCIGTLEERIDQMIEQKKALAESIISAGEAWLTEMSTEQLKEVFTLSRDAVEPPEP